MKDRIIEVINDLPTSEQVALYNEFAQDVYMEEWYEMDEFNDIMRGCSPLDIAYKIFFGDFNPNHNYFTFDGYENLKSADFPDIYADEIAEYCIDNDCAFGNNEIREILDEREGF